MDAQQFDLPPPKNWQMFQDLCHALWEREWKCPNIQKNGRVGQKQKGVDVFGKPGGTKAFYGIQCKVKSIDGGKLPKLSESEVKHEVNEAKKFKPPLRQLIIATTAPEDEAIQEFARKLSAAHAKRKLFEVDVLAWPEIQARLAKH